MNFSRRKPTTEGPERNIDSFADEIIADSRWLHAKNRYMDVYMGLASNANQWRTCCFVMMVLLVFSVIGNIQLSKGSKSVPYVVQVDQHGYAIPIQPADISGIDQRVVSSQIGQFLMNMRTRVRDRSAQKYFAETAYRSIASSSEALRVLNNYFRNNTPFDAKFPVTVEIRSVIPITSETYQAEWVEKMGTEEQKIVERFYQGIFEIQISPPTDVQNLINNPLGVYITDFRVQEKLN